MSNCSSRLSTPVAWIEGECMAKELIKNMTEDIVSASIPRLGGGGTTNQWRRSYYEREHSYVTYALSSVRQTAMYTHTDGLKSNVYSVSRVNIENHAAPDGYWYEADNTVPVGGNTKGGNYRTGVRIFTGDIIREIELVTLVDMHPDRPENTFDNRWEKYQAWIVEHAREDYLGQIVEDKNWNRFKLVRLLEGDWTQAISKGSFRVSTTRNSSGQTSSSNSSVRSSYSVDHFTFTPTLHRVNEKAELTLMPLNGRYHSYIYLEKPLDSNNYIKVSYLNAYTSTGKSENLSGNPEESYEKACEIVNGKAIVVDESEAYYAFERQVEGGYYSPGSYWRKGDDGGTLGMETDIVSYWFYAGNSKLSWLPNKMRDEYTIVKYFISLNNNRISAILEGDPGYDPDSAYISFAYMGFFDTLDPKDNKTNFAVTVGMGEPVKAITGFDYKDIDKTKNPNYARYGRFTSNGMDTVSVARGKSNLMYQEYVPAFLTHLPNYPTVGTVPKGISRLRIDDFFQVSRHTDHAHASPIYLVHGYEGYRGYFDGVVALHDVGVVAGDELDYTIAGYTETYKVFRLISPINFLDKSPVPKNMIIALLMETN